ncbi:hypothetical protein [Mesotoga sp. TolDC]|nr:hypothetical protein [Mesotoga sp. TolDC]
MGLERAKQRSRLGELSGLHGDPGWGELLAIIDLTDEKSED